jgi:hypothetical protein
LFRLGYSYVDAGWAGDIVATRDRAGAKFPSPVAANGDPVVGLARIEYTAPRPGGRGRGSSGERRQYTVPLKGNTNFTTYEAANTDTGKSTLTVREAPDSPRRVIPPDQWAFGRCETGKASLVPTTTDLCLFGGFEPDMTYEWIYPAKNPMVMGLAYAVTRDVASFLRYSTRDDTGQPNPLAQDQSTTGIRRAYGFGASSTGMYMRDWLYLGFNEDESHRKVFDGVRIAVAGTHRLMANVQFADPNVYSGQDSRRDYLSHSIPPLTYGVSTDPLTGKRDGILKRPSTDPFVIQVDSENEFWNMNAALNVHDGRGRAVPLPNNVRLYFATGSSHTGAAGVGAMPTDRGGCANPVNGARSMNMIFRAMLIALDDWADRDIAPPNSVYPSVEDGTLVGVEEARKAFPTIPGMNFPGEANDLLVFDFGPEFKSEGGVLSKLPPVRGAAYAVRVPKPDADGHALGGVRTVDLAVPVGTNVGWNTRGGTGPRAGDVCGLNGAFVPFARTKAERMASGDSRPSLEERYTNHAGFVKAVTQAARQLVAQRLLLEEDAATVIRQAEQSAVLK